MKNKINIDNYIDLLADRRKELGMSATELGKIIGCSRQYVWELEHKKHNLTFAYYLKMCKALKCYVIIEEE